MAEKILSSDKEPDIDININCRKPYMCAFWPYCSKHLPEKSVFNIYRLWWSKKIKYYESGWITYPELLQYAPITNKIQLRQKADVCL